MILIDADELIKDLRETCEKWFAQGCMNLKDLEEIAEKLKGSK